MIIGITGSDGVGKSTLVNKICEMTNWPHLHFDKPKDMEDAKQQYYRFGSIHRYNIVCDRLHEGEWVYAPLYRGYTADYLEDFENTLIKNNNYLQVYVKANLKTILERVAVRGEDFVKTEHFPLVLANFEQFMEKQNMAFKVVDTTMSNIDNDALSVQVAAEKVDAIYNAIREFDSKVDGKVLHQRKFFPRGNVEPRFMIVRRTPPNDKDNLGGMLWSLDSEASTLMSPLKENNAHTYTWYTSLIPFPTLDNRVTERQLDAMKHIFLMQYSLLRPEKVFALDPTTRVYLQKLLPDVKVLGPKNLTSEV